MTVVELMGTIPESGLRLNAFSIVNLCVAVGMTVEFTAHIVHRFLEERGENSEVLSIDDAVFSLEGQVG